jgi:hypothetical protein
VFDGLLLIVIQSSEAAEVHLRATSDLEGRYPIMLLFLLTLARTSSPASSSDRRASLACRPGFAPA